MCRFTRILVLFLLITFTCQLFFVVAVWASLDDYRDVPYHVDIYRNTREIDIGESAIIKHQTQHSTIKLQSASSSNNSVATVNFTDDGFSRYTIEITGREKGEAVITINYSLYTNMEEVGFSKQYTVRVDGWTPDYLDQPPGSDQEEEELTIIAPDVDLFYGAFTDLYYVHYRFGEEVREASTFQVSSQNNAIARVRPFQSGPGYIRCVVHANKIGSTRFEISVEDKTYTVNVTVHPRPEEIESGVQISDLYGEVYIWTWNHEFNDWDRNYAELESILYIGDIVETRGDSGATFSTVDWTTHTIGPGTTIGVGGPDTRESRLQLLFGHLVTNVRRMLDDGTMDVEMSQVMAGAKGTIISFRDDGRTSTITVYEGAVELQSDHIEPALVEAGQQFTVSGDIVTISAGNTLEEELASWPEEFRLMAAEALYQDLGGSDGTQITGPVRGNPIFLWIAIPAFSLAILLMFTAVIIKKRPARSGRLQSDWYLYKANTTHGPYSWQWLVDYAGKGMLSPEDQLFHEKIGSWQPASSIPELSAMLQKHRG